MALIVRNTFLELEAEPIHVEQSGSSRRSTSVPNSWAPTQLDAALEAASFAGQKRGSGRPWCRSPSAGPSRKMTHSGEGGASVAAAAATLSSQNKEEGACEQQRQVLAAAAGELLPCKSSESNGEESVSKDYHAMCRDAISCLLLLWALAWVIRCGAFSYREHQGLNYTVLQCLAVVVAIVATCGHRYLLAQKTANASLSLDSASDVGVMGTSNSGKVPGIEVVHTPTTDAPSTKASDSEELDADEDDDSSSVFSETLVYGVERTFVPTDLEQERALDSQVNVQNSSESMVSTPVEEDKYGARDLKGKSWADISDDEFGFGDNSSGCESTNTFDTNSNYEDDKSSNTDQSEFPATPTQGINQSSDELSENFKAEQKQDHKVISESSALHADAPEFVPATAAVTTQWPTVDMSAAVPMICPGQWPSAGASPDACGQQFQIVQVIGYGPLPQTLPLNHSPPLMLPCHDTATPTAPTQALDAIATAVAAEHPAKEAQPLVREQAKEDQRDATGSEQLARKERKDGLLDLSSLPQKHLKALAPRIAKRLTPKARGLNALDLCIVKKPKPTPAGKLDVEDALSGGAKAEKIEERQESTTAAGDAATMRPTENTVLPSTLQVLLPVQDNRAERSQLVLSDLITIGATKLEPKAKPFKSMSEIRNEICEMVGTLRDAFLSSPNVIGVDVTEGFLGSETTIDVQVNGNYSSMLVSADCALANGKAALVEIAARLQRIYLLGYEVDPFEDLEKPLNGFCFTIASEPAGDERNACWDFYRHGACPRPCSCRWRHPDCSELMRVWVTIS